MRDGSLEQSPMPDILRAGLAELGLDAEKAEPLEEFARLVLEKNRVMNLTAITDEADFARLHLLDSAALLKEAEPDGRSVVDVGTGAGFPGCVLKILRGDISLTLLDSLNKRIVFLGELSAELGLGAECIHGRAEELGRTAEYREQYDVSTARAVANLTALCEYCLPFVRTGGAFVALKGSDGAAELKAAAEECLRGRRYP